MKSYYSTKECSCYMFTLLNAQLNQGYQRINLTYSTVDLHSMMFLSAYGRVGEPRVDAFPVISLALTTSANTVDSFSKRVCRRPEKDDGR